MDVPQLSEDEMAEIKKDVLTRMRHYLCEKIRARCHLDYLRSRRILTRDDAEEINSKSTQTSRTGWLLDILTENPRGLDVLIDSIRELRSQNFVIHKITDEVQKAKNEKLESLRAAASSSSPRSSITPSCTSQDLSNTFSNDSTLLFQPDGQRSPCTLTIGALPSVNSLPNGGVLTSVGSAATSSSLPKPGDPGAPPLPEEDELLVVSPSNVGAVSPGSTSSGADNNFQPLRSRCLTSASHQSNFYLK
ncbi:B-cell lymphoma/leukemia 10 [Corythoichthys intestinalis]|uniref:B-cell lymphoma/leukemia 10 n=1 Tax=Corythoichthys intestinalis TaxID=161448 RepID=UPI0025A66ADE|nr:B-cell lymphoma/leukemia 10 [Corythoichthys intestinalis]XP_061794991.1 B-cell lymphoma/leukemia 10-like [Nerophis lumbriciformis]